MKEKKKVSKVIDSLRNIQADSIVLYMKVHNFHWNVRGGDFVQVHKALEGIYNGFADMFDDIAERIIQLGGTPIVTLAEAIKISSIKEETKTTFVSKEILKELLKIYESLREDFKSLAKLADKDEDRVTASYCDTKLAELDKAIWMVQSQLA